MKIGILLCGRNPEEVAEKFGEYNRLFDALLTGHEFEFETFEVVDMKFPKSVNDCDGWLITGSRHGVYEDHAFIPPLEDFVREAYAQNIPVVGICFGHQLIAQALGGKVEKFKGGWNVGPTLYESKLGAMELIAWHQDQVVEKPESATRLASNDFCENAVLLYGDRAFSMQPHPEFSPEFHAALFKARSSLLPEDYAKMVAAKPMPELTRANAANQIANFFKTRKLEG